MANDKQKVVVAGAGFGGIKAALELAKEPEFEVTIISDQVNFRYYPTLFHTATGGKAVASAIPLSEIFKDKPVEIIEGELKTLDRKNKKVKTTGGASYDYDILIVALGVVTNFFGIKGLDKYAYGIKTQEQARALRDHIHKQLVEDKKPDVNYIVIGGGPTGVELAGAMPAYIHHVMKKHHLRDTKLHIDLVEAAPRLIARMPRSYSDAAAKRLRKLGVKLYLNQTVQAETADQLMVNGKPLLSHTVIWTAGVTNHPFLKNNNFPMNDHGKATVNHQLESETGIYVIGDNADTEFSGMAQTALYDAVFVAENLKRQTHGKSPRNYKAKKPIYVTPVGPRWAVVLWNNVHLYGWIGSFLRSSADLVGYHDYEPWWLATEHWLAEAEDEKTCLICT